MTVGPATADELPRACRVLFAHAVFAESAADRFHEFLTRNELDPAGLIVARRGGAVCGAVFAHRLGGRQAAVWPPVAADDDTRDELVAAALAWLCQEPTAVVQAVVGASELPRTPPLVRAGFRHVTRLTVLARDIATIPTRTALRFVPVPEPTPEFAALLVRTYEGTLDVPELNGRRTGEEVLTGYRVEAVPRWWRIDAAGSPVGVLLLSPTDDPATTELTYVGVVPTARGRGCGRDAVRFGMGEVARTGGRAMTLTVDVRNEPALRMYRALGFREVDRREVFLLFPENQEDWPQMNTDQHR